MAHVDQNMCRICGNLRALRADGWHPKPKEAFSHKKLTFTGTESTDGMNRSL